MEKLTFKSPDQTKEEKKKERLLNEGGIYYEKKKSVDENQQEVEKAIINILGVEIETQASEEDIQQIKEEIILSNLDQTLLRKTAECYKLKQALLFEGDPGAGKTFLFEKFIEMIYGKGCPIDTLVGSPRTSELDILGHWAPRGEKKIDATKYESELKTYQDSHEFRELSQNFNQKLSGLNQKLIDEKITPEDFELEFSEISTEFTQRQKDSIANHFSKTSLSINDADWEFKQGALLRAYAGRGGKGYPLIVDEFNIIPSNYQQIFLQIGGQSGGLSEKVSFFGNGGKTSYYRGQETALFFASNFPEKTEGRSEVVAPMSDRLVWTILSDKEYQEKKRAIKQTAGGRLQNRKSDLFKIDASRVSVPVENGIQWDKVLNERLGEQLADAVDLLDEQFVKSYRDIGDSLQVSGETRKRTQKLEFSGRNPLRLFNYLDQFQVRGESGSIDFTETLKRGYEMYYVSRLSNPDMQKKAWKLFDELMTGDTGKIQFDLERTFEEKIKDIDLGKKLNSPITRKDVLDFYIKKLEDVSEKEEENVSINKLEAGNIFDKWLAWSLDNQIYVPENELAQDIASRLKVSIQKAYETNKPVVFVDTDEKFNKYKNGGLKADEIRQLKISSIVGNIKESLLRYRQLCSEQNSAFSNKVHSILEVPDYLNPQKDPTEQEVLDILNKFISGDIILEPKGERKSVVLSDRQLHDHLNRVALTLENTQELKDVNFVLAHIEAKGYKVEKDKWGDTIASTMDFRHGWTGTNRHDYKETFSKLISLLQGGFNDPIILLGFMTPDMIINGSDAKRDISEKDRSEIKKQMDELFSYKNVKFVQLPFTPDQVKDAILEIQNSKNGVSRKVTKSQIIKNNKNN
jgi:MoxR-like ATPase